MTIDPTSLGAQRAAFLAHADDPLVAVAALQIDADASARSREREQASAERARAHAATEQAAACMSEQAGSLERGAWVAGSVAILGGAASVTGAALDCRASVQAQKLGSGASGAGVAQVQTLPATKVAALVGASGRSASGVADSLDRMVGQAPAQRHAAEATRAKGEADDARGCAEAARERASDATGHARATLEALEGLLQARAAAASAILGRG